MSELMSEGLMLAGYGMGMVFFFLTLLVFATRLMSALIPAEQVAVRESLPDDRIRAVIAAAIDEYRRRHSH